MPVVGEAIVRVRVRSTNLPGDIRDQVTRGLRDMDGDVDRAGDRLGGRLDESFRRRISGSVERSVRRDVNRSLPSLSRLFGGFGNHLGSELAGEFRTGIGAGRPGPAIAAMISLAGPSAVGAAAAVGVAAAGALTAAISSTLLSGGLLVAAFRLSGDTLKAGTKAWSDAGVKFGTVIAQGMASGFERSAGIFADRFVPALEGPLRATGEAFGRMFEGLTNTLTSDENLSRWGHILEQNVRFIDQFTAGLSGLSTSFLILFDASRPMIELVGSKFQQFGEWAANALAAAEANGSLATVMGNLTRLAEALFGWIAKIGPAFGDWLLNLNVEGIITGWESFGRILGDVFDIFGQIADGAGPHFVQIMDNIHGILTNLVESGTIQTVADRVGMLLERFTAFVEELTSSNLGATIGALGLSLLLFGGFLSPIASLLGAIAPAISTVAGALGSLAAPIAVAVGLFVAIYAASEDFRTSIGNLLTAVGGKFMEIWDEISPKLQPLIDNLIKLADAIGQRLAPLIEILTPVFLSLMEIIGTVLGFIIDQVTEFVGFIADILTGDFEGAWEHFQQLFVNLGQFLEDIFLDVRLFIGSIWTAIYDFLRGIWDAIWARAEMWLNDTTNAIHTAFNFIWTLAVTWWTTIYDTIVGIVTNIAITLSSWWNNIVTGVSTAWNFIWTLATTWWNNILNTIVTIVSVLAAILSGWWNTITSAVSAAWNNIWAVGESWWNNISNTIVNIVSNLAAVLSGWWSNITGAVSSAWANLVGVASQWWNNISNTVTGIVSNLAAVLSGWWSNISGAVSSAWSGLQGIVSGIWNGIKNAIVQPIIDAYNSVTEWVGKIVGAVQSAFDTVSSKVGEANSKLNEIIAAQAQAGTVTANMFMADAVAPPAQLARGGVIAAGTGGINAIVGEGRNDERIEPLDSEGLSRRDRALINEIVNTMVTSNAAAGAGPISVQVRIGERELADVMTQVIGASNEALARRISQRRRR